MSISQNCEQSAFNVFDLPRGNIEFSYFFLFSTFSCQIKKRVLKKVVIESNRHQRVNQKFSKNNQKVDKESSTFFRVVKESAKSGQRVRVIDMSSQTYQRVHKGVKKESSNNHQEAMKESLKSCTIFSFCYLQNINN